MPAPVWPGTLPQRPLRDGYNPRPQEALVRTPMEDGYEQARRQRLSIWHETPVRYRMTPAQLATFKAFWNGDLNAGASAFTLPVFGLDGAGYVNRTVRLRDVSYQPVGPADTYVAGTLSIRNF